MDDYIDQLEERIGEAEEQLEANDQYIASMHEQLEEYQTELKQLREQLAASKKRTLAEITKDPNIALDDEEIGKSQKSQKLD